MAKRVVGIGECMIELTASASGAMAVGYAGDSFNSAVYCARLGKNARISVAYVTVLGDDKHSDAIIALAAREQIDTSLIGRLHGRLPGLYMIETDEKGERRFLYWRSASAARDMMRGKRAVELTLALSDASVVFVTGITFSILDAVQRENLFHLLESCRGKGAKIVFDGNYRPRGWHSPATARAVFTRALTLTDIALPTMEDDQLLFGDVDHTESIARMRACGVAEIVIKRGAQSCILADRHTITESPTQPLTAIDTTGAGDSFNAGYLTARLLNHEPAHAAAVAHQLAGVVIGHRGAIIPTAAMPQLSL